MSFIAQPAANLGSPPAIGNVTPNTVAGTVVSAANGAINAPTFALRGTQGLFSPYSGYVGFTDGTTLGLLAQMGTGQIQMTSIGLISWTSSSSSADGAADTVLARAGANMIGLGGTTSSFPAIKRSSAVLQARLADDSAFTQLQGKLTTDANAVTGLTPAVLAAAINATITITDASGQVYRVPCVI